MGTHKESIGESSLRCWQSNGLFARWAACTTPRRSAQHSWVLNTCSTGGIFPHTVTVSTRFTEELSTQTAPESPGNNNSANWREAAYTSADFWQVCSN